MHAATTDRSAIDGASLPGFAALAPASPPGRAALSAFWFVYFAAFGIFLPYFALYLRENAGLSGSETGLVLAAIPLIGFVAQPLWGQVADRTGARPRVLALIAVATGLASAAIALGDGFVQLLALTSLMAFFSTAVVPLAVAVNMAMLGEAATASFGYMRVWGTIGFLLTVVAFPNFLHLAGAAGASAAVSEPRLGWMFPVVGALAFAAALIALRVPSGETARVRARRGEWRVLLRRGAIVRIILFTFATQTCMQGPMTLFPIYVRSLGGNIDTVGRMWVFMILLEIPLVWWSGAGFRRLGPRTVLAVGTLAAGVRWLVCALGSDLHLIYAAQLLHGVVVAGLMIGGSLYLEVVTPPRLRATAQSLLSMAGVGMASIVSNAASGWLLDHVGATAPYLLGGLGALVLGAVVPFVLPPPHGYER